MLRARENYTYSLTCIAFFIVILNSASSKKLPSSSNTSKTPTGVGSSTSAGFVLDTSINVQKIVTTSLTKQTQQAASSETVTFGGADITATNDLQTTFKAVKSKVVTKSFQPETTQPTKARPLTTTKTTTTTTTTTTTKPNSLISSKIHKERADVVTDHVTTIGGLQCNEIYKPIKGEVRMFEEKTADDLWLIKECPEKVVWRQDLCQCDYPVGTLGNGFCSSYRPHPSGEMEQYQRFVNGDWKDETCAVFDLFWDQEECRCDWNKNVANMKRRPKLKPVRKPSINTECLYLLNMTMDHELKDYGSNFWINRQWNAQIEFDKVTGDINGCAMLRNAPMKIEGFSGNDLTTTVRVVFRMKVHPDREKDRNYMVVISNGCKSWSGALRKPSLAVSFRPVNNTFRIQFKTTSKTIEKAAQVKPKELQITNIKPLKIGGNLHGVRSGRVHKCSDATVWNTSRFRCQIQLSAHIGRCTPSEGQQFLWLSGRDINCETMPIPTLILASGIGSTMALYIGLVTVVK